MFDSGERGFGLGPPAAPLAHGGQATGECLCEDFVALSCGGSQHNPQPERQCLRAGGLAQEGFQQYLLWW